jgi:hypothetical protein
MILHNEARVWANSDTSPDNNYTWMDHGVGNPSYNLSIGANWVTGQFVAGGQIGIEFNVTNQGNMPIPGTLVTTTLPAEVEYLFAYAWDWSGWHLFTPTIITEEYLVWDVGNFPNGYRYDVGISFRIADDASPGTPLVFENRIMGQANEYRYDDNVLVFNETVNPYGPNLRVDKHTNWRWNGDGQLYYEVRILNIGTEYQENVVITDTYPISTTFSSCRWNHGPGDLQPCEVDEANHQVIYRLDYMNPGETASAELYVDLLPEYVNQGYTFINQADISNYGDVAPWDNHDEVIAAPSPHLWINLETFGEPAHGNNYDLRVHYNNDGWATAPGVVITQTFEGMTYLSDTSGVIPTVNGNTVVWQLGDLPYNHWSDHWFDVFEHR